MLELLNKEKVNKKTCAKIWPQKSCNIKTAGDSDDDNNTDGDDSNGSFIYNSNNNGE